MGQTVMYCISVGASPALRLTHGKQTMVWVSLTGLNDKAVVDTIVSKARNCVCIYPLSAN